MKRLISLIFCILFLSAVIVLDVQAAGEQIMADVHITVHVKREGGVGSCGSRPWGVDHIRGGDFGCHPPKYWYNYFLIAEMGQKLKITPSTQGSYMISGLEPGGLKYEKLEHTSDGNRVCSPVSIRSSKDYFQFNTTGVAKDGRLQLRFSTTPEEISKWQCRGGHGYERTTSLLLIDWATAMTGKQMTTATELTSQHLVRSGFYDRRYAESMNPSPSSRDYATVQIQFTCFDPRKEGNKFVACPWQ